MATIDLHGATVSAADPPIGTNPNPDLAIKAPVRLATTGSNITLSGLLTIDGVALAAGDRVLVKDQTDATTNGLYNASTGNWTRTIDANNNSQFATGMQVVVTAGTNNAGATFQLTTVAPITIGTSLLTFVNLPSSYVAPFAGAVSRTLNAKLADFVSVKDFGAKGDGAADDTAAIQAAITAVIAVGSGLVYFPRGTYNISSALSVSAFVMIAGAGVGLTTIVQTNLTANAFNINNGGQDFGGIRDIAIRANAPFFNAPGSSGIALNLTSTNENFLISNVWIRNFDIGVKFNACFSNYIFGLTVEYFQTYGVWVPVSGGPTNDLRFSQIKIQNINFVKSDGVTANTPVVLASPPNANSQIGVFYQESGGDVWENADVLNCGSALVLQAPSAKTVAFLSFTDFLADTSVYDNIVLDGSLGTVSNIEFLGIWGAFSTNGSGLLTKGANLTMVQAVGGRLRQNGTHGWNHQGGKNIRFSNVSIVGNSKLATNTSHGVHVAAGVSNWSIENCRIGDNVIDGTTTTQLDNIHIDSGSTDSYSIVGNDLSNPGSGGSPLSNAATGTSKKIRSNFPIQNGVDVSVAAFQGASVSVGAGSTVFLGSEGSNATEANTYFTAHKLLQALRWGVAFTSAPGGGQSYTFQLSYNGVLQGSPVVISGAGVFNSGDQFLTLSLAEYDTLTIRLVTSAGAAAANFRYFIEYGE